MTDAELQTALESRTLAHELWTHRAHVRMAFLYARQNPLSAKGFHMVRRSTRTGKAEVPGDLPQRRGNPFCLVTLLDEIQNLSLASGQSCHTIHTYSIYREKLVKASVKLREPFAKERGARSRIFVTYLSRK